MQPGCPAQPMPSCRRCTTCHAPQAQCRPPPPDLGTCRAPTVEVTPAHDSASFVVEYSGTRPTDGWQQYNLTVCLASNLNDCKATVACELGTPGEERTECDTQALGLTPSTQYIVKARAALGAEEAAGVGGGCLRRARLGRQLPQPVWLLPHGACAPTPAPPQRAGHRRGLGRPVQQCKHERALHHHGCACPNLCVSRRVWKQASVPAVL